MAQEGVSRPQVLPIDEGLSGQVFQSQSPILRTDLANDPDDFTDDLVDCGLHAFAGVPLRGVEQSLGILEVYHSSTYGFDDQMVAFFIDVGDRVGIALQNAELFQRAQMLLIESSTLNVSSA